MLELNVPAHPIGKQHVLQPVDGDRLDGARDFGAAWPEPTKLDSDGGERHEGPGRDRNRNLSTHVKYSLQQPVL
jgi:hypothetical protein